MSKIFKLNDYEFLIFEDCITPPGHQFLIMKKGFYDHKNGVMQMMSINYNYLDKSIYDLSLERYILEDTANQSIESDGNQQTKEKRRL